MKSIYATHGIPEELVSDGGPPYNSNLMMNFFRQWGIKHPVTPPHYPRINGQIESSANSQLKPTFDVERAREALRKRQIIQNKYANKHATVLPLLPQNAKERMSRVFRRIRFHIRQDKTENDNPRWSRSVEDLYNSDATEISRNPNDSADRQINASPKTNRSNINQQFQVPIETFSEQSNTAVRKSSRNIVKRVRYRDS
ncbi:integrase catalytic domain-containing protein [Trichonephila clavipes]|nr:integrase catalytic domain-containing protein [Trichonephila clavipes]